MTDPSHCIAISMGDPTGIGPEVTLKAIANSHRGIILVGDIGVYEEAARRLRLPLRFAERTSTKSSPRGAVPVLVVSDLPAAQRRPGKPTTVSGRAAYAAIVDAVGLVQSGVADALVTAPICKANLAAAGVRAPGHTELLAQLTRASAVRMMMAGPRLRVMLVTTHFALVDVPDAITRTNVLETIRVADQTLRRQFKIRKPRIGVAGLNPHAGEQGLFGREEIDIIAPAVKAAQRAGIVAFGPLAADTLIPRAAQGACDLVVCMYHDQGLAPFKLIHFNDGVNVTCGLPFVRTSPDHGTAHDIAGKGIADPRSMRAAIRLATELRIP